MEIHRRSDRSLSPWHRPPVRGSPRSLGSHLQQVQRSSVAHHDPGYPPLHTGCLPCPSGLLRLQGLQRLFLWRYTRLWGLMKSSCCVESLCVPLHLVLYSSYYLSLSFFSQLIPVCFFVNSTMYAYPHNCCHIAPSLLLFFPLCILSIFSFFHLNISPLYLGPQLSIQNSTSFFHSLFSSQFLIHFIFFSLKFKRKGE